MIKNTLFTVLFLLFTFVLRAQNCTVNANVDRTFCLTDTVSLSGFRAGALSGGSTWTQVSGPSLIINQPNSLSTNISGKVPGTFVFNLRNRCTDGSNANDQVTITILSTTKAIAGPDQDFCPGTYDLAANQPGSGETGTWTYIDNSGDVQILNINNPISSFSTFPSNGGISTLRWTISNVNGCSSYDEVQLTNFGGVMPVRTADSITLSQCYSVFTSSSLIGSFSGRGLGGQSAYWSALSGPNLPTMGNITTDSAFASGLIEGEYYFEYSVSGPCANGKDTLKVIVPTPLGELSPSTGQIIYLCDRPTIYVLNASPPIYVNDTCTWRQISGPTTVTFNPINTASTTVSGLSGQARDFYQFSYTMENPLTRCIQSSLFTITYLDSPAISTSPNRILLCNQDTALLRFRDTGGRFTTFTQLSGPKNATFNNISSDNISKYVDVSDMDVSGTYIFKIRRTSGFGQGCTEVETDVRVITSMQPGPATAGSSQRLNCNVDTTQLAGNIPSEGIGYWYQNSGPNVSQIDDTTYHLTTVRNLIGGTYQYRWYITGGQACNPTQDDVDVLVADTLPISAAGGTDQTICFKSVLNLQGNLPNAGSSGVWRVFPDSGIVFTDSTNHITDANGMDSGKIYNFIWTIYNSCGFKSDTVAITITSDVAAIPSDAGDDRCLPDTTSIFTLDGNIPWPGTGKWTQSSGPSSSIVNDTVYNTAVLPSGPGHYVFKWTIGNSLCQSGNDSVMISISDTVTPAFAGANVDTCSNNLILSGNLPIFGKGHWSLNIGRINGNMTHPDSNVTEVLSLSQGTYIYRWTIDNGACGISFDDVKVNIANPNTVPVAQTGQLWCSPSFILLTANRITSGKGYWSMQGVNPTTPFIAQIDSPTTAASGFNAGIYTFKWNSYNPMGICPDLYSLRYDTIIYPANAGNDAILCRVYNYPLNGTAGSKGYWRQISGDTADLDTTGNNSAVANNMSSAGSPYLFVYEISPSYGCANPLDTMRIDIYDSTTTPNAGPDQNLCDADTFHLSGNDVSPDNGLWSQVNGPMIGSFENSSNENTRFYGINGGSYLLKWTSSNLGCVKSDFVLIRNYDSSLASFAGNDTSICPPLLQLNANITGQHSAHWHQISGPDTAIFLSGIDPNTSVSNLVKGTYVFEWIITNGYCPSTRDTVVISIPYDQPDDALAGNDTALCNQTGLNLNGNSPSIGSGSWSQISGILVNLVDDTLYNSGLSGLDTGTTLLEWKITNGNCSNTDTMSIINYQLPTEANCSPDSGFCLYSPVNIYANAPSTGIGKWTVVSGSANVVDSNSNISGVSGLSAGTFKFEWSISNGICASDKDTVTISIDSIPSLSDAGPDKQTCLSMVTLSAGKPNSGIGTWHFISGMNTPTLSDLNSDTSTVSGLDSGSYSYEWEVAKGSCKNKDTMLIRLTDPQLNDQCLQATEITDPGGNFYGDLCGAKKFGAEPSTGGYDACNTIFYRFKTIGYNYVKSININITGMNNCPGGIRVSLFDSGACPGLGMQHDSTVFMTGSGLVVFDSLKSNQAYVLVIDEFRIPCGKTECNLVFNVGGNALPVEAFDFDAVSRVRGKAEITWRSDFNPARLRYDLYKIESGYKTLVGSLPSNNQSGINAYKINDLAVYSYPVEYQLMSIMKSGDIKEAARKTLNWENASPFKLYPNPSNSIVTISTEDVTVHRQVDLYIYNSSGVMIESVNSVSFFEGNVKIDGRDWAPGLYHVLLYSNGKLFTLSLEIVD